MYQGEYPLTTAPEIVKIYFSFPEGDTPLKDEVMKIIKNQLRQIALQESIQIHSQRMVYHDGNIRYVKHKVFIHSLKANWIVTKFDSTAIYPL